MRKNMEIPKSISQCLIDNPQCPLPPKTFMSSLDDSILISMENSERILCFGDIFILRQASLLLVIFCKTSLIICFYLIVGHVGVYYRVSSIIPQMLIGNPYKHLV